MQRPSFFGMKAIRHERIHPRYSLVLMNTWDWAQGNLIESTSRKIGLNLKCKPAYSEQIRALQITTRDSKGYFTRVQLGLKMDSP